MLLNLIIRRVTSDLYILINRRNFKFIGKSCRIYSPLKMGGIKNIKLGNNVIIEYKSWLAAIPIKMNDSCILEIGEGTSIGHFNHIYATKKIIIGKRVLTADKVYISDNLHVYEDINIPIIDQPIRQVGEVNIGDGTWIGENVCIIGAKIGKNCVIGANSVVTKDISDYSIAVGSPAKIIKKFNFETQNWEKLNTDGSSIII